MASFLPSRKFESYITIVLSQVHPDRSISSECLSVVDSLLVGVRNQLASSARDYLLFREVTSSSSPEVAALNESHIQSAVKDLIPGELGKHAHSEGQKAVTKYKTFLDRPDAVSSGTFRSDNIAHESGLVFPATAVYEFLQSGGYAPSVDIFTGIYLAAIIEYLSAEVLELAGNASRDEWSSRASEDNDDGDEDEDRGVLEIRHVTTAIEQDSELEPVFSPLLAKGFSPRLTKEEYRAMINNNPRDLLRQDAGYKNPLDRARINDEEDEVIAFLEGMFVIIMSVNDLYPNVSDEEFKEKLQMWDDL